MKTLFLAQGHVHEKPLRSFDKPDRTIDRLVWADNDMHAMELLRLHVSNYELLRDDEELLYIEIHEPIGEPDVA
jgi:hypothetical protein